jgi:hypothetical protein
MYKWFHANGGTEKLSLERPLITDDLKGQRLSWVKLYWLLLTDPEAAVGMLGMKWFYKTNRMRKLKHLPRARGDGEDAGEQPY